MRRIIDRHNDYGVLWSAKTKNFYVYWAAEYPDTFKYDGDDPDGDIQRDIENGDLVIFDSKVWVEDGHGVELGADYLGASVYRSGQVAQFIHDGYFMDMLHRACDEARRYVARRPTLREATV